MIHGGKVLAFVKLFTVLRRPTINVHYQQVLIVIKSVTDCVDWKVRSLQISMSEAIWKKVYYQYLHVLSSSIDYAL